MITPRKPNPVGDLHVSDGAAASATNDTCSAVAGYRALDVDYNEDGFVFDVVQQGPRPGGKVLTFPSNTLGGSSYPAIAPRPAAKSRLLTAFQRENVQ